MGIFLIFGTFGKKCGVGYITLSGALKPPVRQLRNGFSNSAQNLDSETIFKPFGLDGWFKSELSLGLPGLTFFSHGTTHSAGVIIHIGKNLEFKMTDKIIDTNGRFIILLCEVQGTKCLIVNIYAPNTENLQLQFLSEVEQCILISKYI